MSIRLDPRRANALKHLAGEAGVRPGDLVRHWVEERLDAERGGTEAGASAPTTSAPTASAAPGLLSRVDALTSRVAALEASAAMATTQAEVPTSADPEPPSAPDDPPMQVDAPKRTRRSRTVSAAPSDQRVALHDEMIALIGKRGPMTAGDLAAAITERGRYVPPRSGKPLDAATVSQRVSNPTYRSRFTRSEGRIGLAE